MTRPTISLGIFVFAGWLSAALALGQQAGTDAPPATARATAPADWKPLTCRFIGDVPLVSVKARGKDGLFMVDTGSPVSLLDEGWARQVGLSVTESHDLSQRLEGVVENPDLDVSGDRFAPARVPCSSLQDLTGVFGVPIAGVLGIDFLRGRVLRLDYVAESIGLGPADGFSYNGPGVIVPLTLDGDGHPFSTGLVNGEPGESMGTLILFDTGYNGAVRFSDDFARLAGLRIDAGQFLDDGVEFRGRRSETMRIGHVRSISLGRLELKPHEVKIERSNIGVTIGGETFYNYVDIIDCPRSRFIFEPNPAAEGRARSAVGLDLETALTGDGLRVKRVMAGLSAEKAGILAGDILLKIEGNPVKDLGYAKMEEVRNQARRDGRDLHMKFRRGDKVLEVTIPTQ